MSMIPEVCVVGGGVVGLSSAVCIQTLVPRVKVTVMADGYGRDTTSDGAAGVFLPTVERIPGVDTSTLTYIIHLYLYLLCI